MELVKKYTLLLLFIIPCSVLAQQVELFQQFNGRFDYVAFGNTLNLDENTGQTPPAPCEILTESSAELNLLPQQQIVVAYLYWAGVGDGDFTVSFNGNEIIAARTFSEEISPPFNYFAAFADVTTIVTQTGNGIYTLSELDLTQVIPEYCGNTTNFGGWAVTVIYEDPSLTQNQLNVFDGLQGVSAVNSVLDITLQNLNVLDNTGAKIGFLAWEGDLSLANNETLRINGNIISNPPLNPADNAFNGTNSFTNMSMLYNMDIDVYNIENNISPGDTSATIQLTSNQDFVMVNNIITVLNTELPDATIEIDNLAGGDVCGDRNFDVDYTVYNVNSTDILPANTPIAFYANATFIGLTSTTIEIPIDGSESRSINLTIPNNIPADFVLKASVDDNGTGNGIVNELNEENNDFTVDIHLLAFPQVIGLTDLQKCDIVGVELFDLTQATQFIDPINIITYHHSEEDAQNNVNAIPDPDMYLNISNPETIWIRVDNTDCFVVDSFQIEIIICPLPDATITVDNDLNACRQRDLFIEYTVSNTLGTAPLPSNTPIAFYINGVVMGQSETLEEIPIMGNEQGNISITIPDSVPDQFVLDAVVDDSGNGNGVVFELDETNNFFGIVVNFMSIPPIPTLPDLLLCDEGFNTAIFDLNVQNDLISTNPNDQITYFTNLDDAIANSNPIANPDNYQNLSDPQTIYVRLENDICFTTASFLLTTENCAPIIYQGMSPNNDGSNDVFIIERLLNVFNDFELSIYSREGNLIYKGGNEEGLWDGIPNEGILRADEPVPVGTYYYVLRLMDPNFQEPYLGWIYVNY